MYVFKHMESGQYFAGSGWYTKLTRNISEAKIYAKPEAAYPRAQYGGTALRKQHFSIIPVQIREARDLTDTGEDE